ncbi:MAG: ABC transporter ATP-binding protein [Gemmatimonadales bacterium]|nr:ABC transporter ATP-binding protein [Gemmatimonadales bacterium]
MIEVEGLHKVYGDIVAVEELTFAVGAGEVVGLVGPNGAGKSTTLRALAGIVVPTRGRIRIAGHDLGAAPVAAKSELAFVPDEPHLFEYLTVVEHLRFTARLYRVLDVEDQIPALLGELELQSKRDALPGELSRGMRQKLAMGCALLHRPAAMLLDEPLTGLDPSGMRKMTSTIRQRAAAGTAILLSSHLLQLVEAICTRVVVMRHGRAVASGSMADIVRERPDLAGRSLEELFLALVSDDAPGA